ncbi:MAG: hypothetical protein AAFP90_16150 [Planctomycetota bacterium]
MEEELNQPKAPPGCEERYAVSRWPMTPPQFLEWLIDSNQQRVVQSLRSFTELKFKNRTHPSVDYFTADDLFSKLEDRLRNTTSTAPLENEHGAIQYCRQAVVNLLIDEHDKWKRRDAAIERRPEGVPAAGPSVLDLMIHAEEFSKLETLLSRGWQLWSPQQYAEMHRRAAERLEGTDRMQRLFPSAPAVDLSTVKKDTLRQYKRRATKELRESFPSAFQEVEDLFNLVFSGKKR